MHAFFVIKFEKFNNIYKIKNYMPSTWSRLNFIYAKNSPKIYLLEII